jgi:hypothetical protein
MVEGVDQIAQFDQAIMDHGHVDGPDAQSFGIPLHQLLVAYRFQVIVARLCLLQIGDEVVGLRELQEVCKSNGSLQARV